MGKMVGGGVEAVVMNYYKNIDRKKVQFDFFVDNDSLVVPETEILSLGGKVYRIPPYQHIFAYMKTLKRIFKENKYKIVHSNINTLSVFPLMVAYRCKIPVRIMHNHSTAASGETKKNLLKYFLRLLVRFFPSCYFFPTEHVARWTLKEKKKKVKYYIIKNAIHVEEFSYNSSIRNQIRKELNYSNNDFLIGNIGRMVWQKNQKFVIEIFREVKNLKPNSKLLIIGNGPLKNELENDVQKMKISSDVKFLEITENIYNYYQAMDLFLFPSNYEGLGMVAIEAQVSGLPTYCSDKVPRDVEITDLCMRESLDLSKHHWAKMIVDYSNISQNRNRRGRETIIKRSGYDINEAAANLVNIYLSLI